MTKIANLTYLAGRIATAEKHRRQDISAHLQHAEVYTKGQRDGFIEAFLSTVFDADRVGVLQTEVALRNYVETIDDVTLWTVLGGSKAVDETFARELRRVALKVRHAAHQQAERDHEAAKARWAREAEEARDALHTHDDDPFAGLENDRTPTSSYQLWPFKV